MKKLIGFFSTGAAFAGILLILAGCAADKNPPFGAAELVSDPPGADVISLQDDSTLGTTPFKFARETPEGEAEYIVVRVTKPGYQEEIVSFFLSTGYDDAETAMENSQLVEIGLMPAK